MAFFLKDALWGWGGYKGGVGGTGRPKGLGCRRGLGGVERLMAVRKKGEGWGLVGCSKEEPEDPRP